MDDIYIAPDNVREQLIAWIMMAQALNFQARVATERFHEYPTAALLLEERDHVILKLMQVQEWADTHTEYNPEEFLRVKANPPYSVSRVREWWLHYGTKMPVDLAEVIW